MAKRKFSEEEKKAFRRFADAHAPRSSHLADGALSFVTGGAICVIGQAISDGYTALGASPDTLQVAVPVTLIFLSCLFTGLGWYEKLASRAGGGTLVPITGFANAVCAPAIDAKPEGFVLGVGTRMFTIAGPVIVYGSAASVVWGAIYYALRHLS